jgi:hypothetical protein
VPNQRFPSLVVVIALLLAVCVTTEPRAQVPSEDTLKAAFVSKFPQFVEWPPDALTGRATIELCVAPPGPFGTNLRDMTAGSSVGGVPVAVRTVDDRSDVSGCHLLFVPARSGSSQRLLAAASMRPILTVGDDSQFLDDGGMVALKVVGGRVHFEIDANTARRAGLRISSQLLRLADAVRGGGA